MALTEFFRIQGHSCKTYRTSKVVALTIIFMGEKEKRLKLKNTNSNEKMTLSSPIFISHT